jgi:hypothetical protein
MKLDLSPQEYLDLLDLLHIADVVMSGHRREEDQRTTRHRALVQKLYGLAGSEGRDRLIRHDPSANKFVPTGEFEEHSLAHPLINEFGDHLFWDELIARLTVRDAALIAGGIEQLNAMSHSDRHVLEGPIRQRYIEEFTASGITNLEVVARYGSGGEGPVETSD